MVDHIHLIGADDVRSASYRMKEAAETMSSAASTISTALEQHAARTEEWLQRFEAAVEKASKTPQERRAEVIADDYLPSMAKG